MKKTAIEGSGFTFLHKKFPRMSKKKLKASIFDGPQIRKLMKGSVFDEPLSEVKLPTANGINSYKLPGK